MHANAVVDLEQFARQVQTVDTHVPEIPKLLSDLGPYPRTREEAMRQLGALHGRAFTRADLPRLVMIKFMVGGRMPTGIYSQMIDEAVDAYVLNATDISATWQLYWLDNTLFADPSPRMRNATVFITVRHAQPRMANFV